MESEDPRQCGTNLQEEKISGGLQGSSERSHPRDETKDDAEARNDFWSSHFGSMPFHPKQNVRIWCPLRSMGPLGKRRAEDKENVDESR